MGGGAKERPPTGEGREGDEPVIPARAVLTELARGFLLVQESNPVRARQFALTFLREHAIPEGNERVETPASVTPARRVLGRYPRGAVEPLPPRLSP
jgi:hypothetical protein